VERRRSSFERTTNDGGGQMERRFLRRLKMNAFASLLLGSFLSLSLSLSLSSLSGADLGNFCS